MRSSTLRAIPMIVAAAIWGPRPGIAAEVPNVVLIYCDDLGYADLGCYGSKVCRTPNLDRMAAEGVRFTDFYVSSAVCSASRAALLTGAYHERVGIRGALGPKDRQGLNHSETTLAELLKDRGYATGMAGKWHLGCRASQLPVHHGFDEFLGVPYSADMWPLHPEAPKSYPPLPLIEGDRVAIADVTPDDQREFTTRFADRAVAFIRRQKDRPFFFYLAPNMPHVPLFVRKDHEGRTGRGAYADVIAEIDDAVGRVLGTLKELGLDDKTLVIFSSDNGPWLSYGDHAGSAGPLREGKGTSYEGGIRVPMIARWPGTIPAGSTRREPTGTIDILPTVAALARASLPDRLIDGQDLTPLLLGDPRAKAPHDALFFYYADGQLQALRSGRWKLMFPHTARSMIGQAPGYGGTPGKYKSLPVGLELYDLEADLGETKNLASDRPEVVHDLQAKADEIRAQLGDSLRHQAGNAVRAAGLAHE
jgi:arylsulfatase A-like enzyme